MEAFLVGFAALAGILLGFWLRSTDVNAEKALLQQRNRELETSLSAARDELAQSRAESNARAGFEALAQEREKNATEMAAERDKLRDEVQAKTGELAAVSQQLKDGEERYAQMKADLESAFKGVAADALRANTESFLVLAKQELGGQAQEANNTLEMKEQAIRNLLDPLSTALSSLDTQTRELETARAGAYGKVETLIETMQRSIPASLDALKIETAQLISALRAPKTRGNWGELQLKRCVEYAGMLAYCSFSEQVSARDDEDRLLRPDMTISLPNGREIVVDAKTPLEAFLNAPDANPDTQKQRFEAHALRVREHLKELDKKAYWSQFEKAPDFVVCFLPSEALFSAALEADPSLIEFSARNRVVMATPTTLIALLRAVEFGWQQSQITENAKTIQETGKKIYEKLVMAQNHVAKLGNALSNSVDYYNKFLGTIEGKGGLFFHGRQLGELVHSDSELEEVEKLPPGTREIESQEWLQPVLALAASESETEY
jgi:DNA recombination protein RmuC